MSRVKYGAGRLWYGPLSILLYSRYFAREAIGRWLLAIGGELVEETGRGPSEEPGITKSQEPKAKSFSGACSSGG